MGFRWFVWRRANELAVAGWVRNRRDGAVEGEAQGDAESLARLQASLREGPAMARVEELTTEVVPPKPGDASFEIL